MLAIDPLTICVLAIGGVLAVPALLKFGFRKSGSEAQSLDARLRDVEAKLASNFDDPELHLYHADLLLRSNAPYTALKSLEQAFVHGMSNVDMEPTFWGCYDNITSYRYRDNSNNWRPGDKIWRRLLEEAPTLMPSMAANISMCDAKYVARWNDATKISDQKCRDALLEQHPLISQKDSA